MSNCSKPMTTVYTFNLFQCQEFDSRGGEWPQAEMCPSVCCPLTRALERVSLVCFLRSKGASTERKHALEGGRFWPCYLGVAACRCKNWWEEQNMSPPPPVNSGWRVNQVRAVVSTLAVMLVNGTGIPEERCYRVSLTRMWSSGVACTAQERSGFSSWPSGYR